MRDPWVSVGGFVWMLTLLGARVTLCRETPDDFVTQWKSECHFLNGTERCAMWRDGPTISSSSCTSTATRGSSRRTTSSGSRAPSP
uniref:MHC class II truncated beta chain n=1 Tax=Ambystoma mexicanum TaxID=8296 RepID=Q9GIP8_AMBME|nr:MHC class II truncated beta chain [Ambystoma mexicanum]